MRMIRSKLRSEVGIPSEAGFPIMGPQHYLTYLETLHRQLKPKVYLEIGTESGASLSLATCTSVAVDPAFRLQMDVSRNKPQLHQFQGMSDDFFASGLLGRLGLTLDLAFLDGMHLFEFLLRDFINTERHMSPDGVVALHDCVPFNRVVAKRSWDKAETTSWTGDVWKVVAILREYRPDLDVSVLDLAPTGLVEIRNLDPANDVLPRAYGEIVERYLPVTLDSYGLAAFSRMMAVKRAGQRSRALTKRAAHSGVIAIKTCVPSADERANWGDFHFAESLAAAFERAGYRSRVDIMPDWADAPADDALDLILQGHDHSPPRDGIPAILWLIYPGKRFPLEACLDYDHVFVASDIFARKLARRVPGTSPSVLYQVFDSEVMKPTSAARVSDLVFVANNHFGHDRPIAVMAREAGEHVRIWGKGWDGDGWRGWVEGETIANRDLGATYGSASAVLCDHTAVMARNGFLSNRVFDALACATPVIMDRQSNLPAGFDDMVTMVDGPDDFAAAAAAVRSESTLRQAERRVFADKMRVEHSFDARVRQIEEKARELSLL